MSAANRASPGSDGFVSHSLEALSASLAYFRARLQLASIEGKEAAVHYAVILALTIAALMVIGFGYFFSVLALVFLIARAFQDSHAWIWVSLAMGALHFVAAAVFLWFAKRRMARPMFTHTLHEFDKDQEWLSSKTQNSR